VNKTSLGASQVLCSFITLALSGAAAGAELEYGLLAGGSYSDNVERVPTNEQSSGAAVVGFDLRGERTTGRLLYDVYADLEYRDYFEEGVDSQEFGRFIAQTSYAFIPETFNWMLSGSFDQVREELLRPLAPDNLENVITLSTGPQVTVRLSDTVIADAQAHYTTADYSESSFDSNTAGAVLTVGRTLSERSYLGVGAAYDDVSYDVERGILGPDYERFEYFLRFNTEGARTTLAADVGYTEISGVAGDDGSPMARVRLTRRLTPFVAGFLAYSHEFSTSADAAFTPDAEQGDLAADSSILTPAAPREYGSAELGLTLSRPRTEAALTYARRSESTAGIADADRDYDQLYASFSRLLTTRSSIGLYGSYSKENIDTGVSPLACSLAQIVCVGEIESEDTVIGARGELALGRALSLEVRVEHRKRDSDASIGEYEEMSGGIFVRYGSARRDQSLAALR
jgi:hypothetical protein